MVILAATVSLIEKVTYLPILLIISNINLAIASIVIINSFDYKVWRDITFFQGPNIIIALILYLDDNNKQENKEIIIFSLLVLLGELTLSAILFFCTNLISNNNSNSNSNSNSISNINDILDVIVIDNTHQNDCSICLQNIENEASKIKNCNHIYHQKCIADWLIKYNNNSCPLCRQCVIIE